MNFLHKFTLQIGPKMILIGKLTEKYRKNQKNTVTFNKILLMK